MNDNSMNTEDINTETRLLSKRNEALWRSIKNFGDAALEKEFKDTCIALTRNTHVKRKFIESINTVQQNIAAQHVLLT